MEYSKLMRLTSLNSSNRAKFSSPSCRIMVVIRHFLRSIETYRVLNTSECGAVQRFLTPPFNEISIIYVFTSKSRGSNHEICNFLAKEFIHILRRASVMTSIEGFCMKCKTYGPINNGKKIVMSNGRTRFAGTCSQPNCTGRISKIIS